MNSWSKISFVVLAGVLLVTNQNCSKVSFVSMAELTAVTKKVFFNPQVLGVLGANGLPSENLRITSVDQATTDMVKDCSAPVKLADGSTQDRYSWERERALEKAEADADNKTIPVEYAISFGDKEDRLAFWAHNRAILSDSNPGHSIIPIGGKTLTGLPGGKKAYYVVDHSEAKADYIGGQRCFFDTVKVTDYKEMGGYYDFITAVETDGGLIHKIHYMMYGWCGGGTTKCADENSKYGPGNYGKDTYPNRLFSTLDQPGPDGKPQIVKLYVADLRNGHFGINGKPIIQVDTGTARGVEVQIDLLKQMDIRTLYRNTGKVIRNLSHEYTSESGQVFAGMSGVPQLIHNLLVEGMDGTVLAGQYTPIVLDLGKPEIRTSDTFGGTLFNMSASKNPNATGPEDEYDILELTSWLGGDLVDVQVEAEKEDGFKFAMDVRRIADDGFLTLPDADGKVRSSRNLFGDNMEVNGEKFANGFLALQAYAKKDCQSLEIKDRYLGPWDEAYQVLKIWVDANRNGKVDDKEMASLEASGVAALNTCNVVSTEEHDQFGNGSALRSAFLFAPGETLDEQEIIKRIETGKTANSKEAEFRVAIDLIFQTRSATESPRLLAPQADLRKLDLRVARSF